MQIKISRINLFMMAVAVIAMVAIFATPTLAVEKAKQMTITGTVVEMAKDQQGKLTGVAVKTEKEGEFKIVERGKGAELMKMLNKKVEVTGAVQESKGKKTIDVLKYEVME